jgi:hypothetical protein
MTQEFGGGCGRIEIEIDPYYNRKDYIEGIMRLINSFGLGCFGRESAHVLRSCLDQIRIRIEDIR